MKIKKVIAILASNVLFFGNCSLKPVHAVTKMSYQYANGMDWAAVSQALLHDKNIFVDQKDIVRILVDQGIYDGGSLEDIHNVLNLFSTKDLMAKSCIFLNKKDVKKVIEKLAKDKKPFAYYIPGHWILITGCNESGETFYYKDSRRNMRINPIPDYEKSIEVEQLLNGHLYLNDIRGTSKEWAICYFKKNNTIKPREITPECAEKVKEIFSLLEDETETIEMSIEDVKKEKILEKLAEKKEPFACYASGRWVAVTDYNSRKKVFQYVEDDRKQLKKVSLNALSKGCLNIQDPYEFHLKFIRSEIN